MPSSASQPGIQLPMADIDANHMAGASLQQAVGEAAGRLPDIETMLAVRRNAGFGQRAGQLEAATRDETVFRVGFHGQRRFWG